jgi:outer membrane protein OmpA-like peptidoglycan-associated protein/tetratricopeptide (TPR) repeat protein
MVMNYKTLILSIVTLVLLNISFAQENRDAISYVKITEELTARIAKGEKSLHIYQDLADAYYFNGIMDMAAKWYKAALELEFQDNMYLNKESYFRFVHSLKATGNYKEADKIMKQISLKSPEDYRVKLYLESSDYLSKIEENSRDFELENLSINSKYSDFGSTIYNSNLVFASSRGEGKLYDWNKQPYLDLYQLDTLNNIINFSKNLNTKYHESSAVFTKDGNTIYFTRNNYYKGKFKKNSKNIHSLKIYKASNIDGKWTNITPLPFNNDEYSVAHPALNEDETVLYFSSDMPGTVGNSDIFKVTINPDGSFGTPTNLGLEVNTEGRENFPFIDKNGALYFSSDGHLGLGGLDVFQFNGKVSTNLGKPINSPKDDFAYSIDLETRKGFITSNRAGGKGDDDIYSFIKNDCKQLVTGLVVDQLNNEIILNAKLAFYHNGENITSLMTDQNGAFSIELPCEEDDYMIDISKEGYEKSNTEFKTSVNGQDVKLDLNLKPEFKPAEVGTDLFKFLGLQPLLFDYNKFNINKDASIELDKVITYLQTFPKIKVDVRSHTDSRGKDAYNLYLSQRRNKATIDYIIKNGGISKQRISGNGYGETKLLNKCSNKVKCTDQEHQENRRSEFIIVEN